MNEALVTFMMFLQMKLTASPASLAVRHDNFLCDDGVCRRHVVTYQVPTGEHGMYYMVSRVRDKAEWPLNDKVYYSWGVCSTRAEDACNIFGEWHE